MTGYAPASFHDLYNKEVESDGSSISDFMAPSIPCPGSALWQTPGTSTGGGGGPTDSHPLDHHAKALVRAQEHGDKLRQWR